MVFWLMYYTYKLSKKVGTLKQTHVLWQDFSLLVGFESLNQKSNSLMALTGLDSIMNLQRKLCVAPFPSPWEYMTEKAVRPQVFPVHSRTHVRGIFSSLNNYRYNLQKTWCYNQH